MTKRLKEAIVVCAAAAGCALWPADGRAQTLTPPLQRPVQGVFGRGQKPDGLDVSLSTFEGYDDDQLGYGLEPFDPHTQKSGAFDGLDGSVLLRRKLRHVSFQGGEQSSVRYYPGLEDLVSVRHGAAGGFTAEFDRTRLNFTQTLAYVPFYSYSTLPQLFDAQLTDVAMGPDQFLLRRPALIIESTGGLTQKLGRATLTLSGSSQRTDFTHETGTDLLAESASGRLVYHVTRDFGLVGGYEYQRGDYGVGIGTTPTTVEFHNILVGVDYDHALSLTRRTKVGFATGSTVVRDLRGASQYRVIGDARISRELGRTWAATASYHRGAGLIAGFAQPMFLDSATAGLLGSVSRRLMLSMTAGYSKGELESGNVNGTESYSGSARFQYALSRYTALSAEYGYYWYRFDHPVGLPDGLAQQLHRQSARVGLTVWLPLFR